MALDAPAVAYGSLPPANLAAARQHVQTLSARDREALLRALLEQYEQPSTSSRSRGSSLANSTPQTHSSRSSSSTTTGSISAFMSSSLFDCPPLPEESEEDFAVFSATDLQSASAISPTADASRWTAAPIPSPTHSQRLRSQSVSLTTSSQPLRSSYSTSQLQDPSIHGRSRSFSSIPDVPAPLQLPSTKQQSSRKMTTSTGTSTTTSSTAIKKPRSKPVLRIKTSAADFQDKEPSSITLSSTTKTLHSYWCTACGEKLGDRTAWVLHDVACRGKERSLSRADDSRDATSHSLTQRAWACGFCAAFLGSLERYQSHVAGHFERGRTLGHWHFANVIYGLLHQPAIHKPWKRLWAARAAALPSHLRPKATWSPGCCLLGRETMDEPVTLQEALELFDPSHESASALALQADALAIYISVPIDEEAEKRLKKHSRTHKSDPTHTKPRADTSTKVQEVQVQAPKVSVIQRPDSPPSPASSTTNLLPPPEPVTALSPAPNNTHNNNSSTHAKDAPLPAIPSFSTFQTTSTLSLPSSSSSPPEASKKDAKRGSKLSPRKPLFLFRSKSPSSSPESATEKVVPVKTKTVLPTKKTPARQSQSDKNSSPPTAKLSKPRRVVSTPVMTASSASNPKTNASTTTTATKTATKTETTKPTATTSRTAAAATTSSRNNNWADRPLPPLIIDDFGIISNRPTANGTPVYTTTTANYANYANYAKDQPPKPPPKPRAYTPADTMGDWNSIATTIVDDIMGPVNALHITV